MQKTKVEPITWRFQPMDPGKCMRQGCQNKAANKVVIEIEKGGATLRLLLCAGCSLMDAEDLVYPKGGKRD